MIAGAFYQRQTNFIHQDYQVDDLAAELSVNGLPGTLWLTQQKRKDKDYALFGEASWDVTPQITLTGGGRCYKFDNTFDRLLRLRPQSGRSAATVRSRQVPPNVAGSNRTGVAQCFTASGERLYDRDTDTYGTDRTLLPPVVIGQPLHQPRRLRGRQAGAEASKDSGFTHRLNAQWKPQRRSDVLRDLVAGFRPGGINRRGELLRTTRIF